MILPFQNDENRFRTDLVINIPDLVCVFCESDLFVVFTEILKTNTQPDSVQWLDSMCVKLLNGLSDDFSSSSFAFAFSLGTERLVNLFSWCFPSFF